MKVERWKDCKHEKKKNLKCDHRVTWELCFTLEATWILMDPGLFSHDQEGMGRNMESNNVCGSSIFLLAE